MTNTAKTTTTIHTVGTRGEGEWAHVTVDDGTYTVTVYDGWGITNEARFSGTQASEWADLMMQTIGEDLTSR